MLIPRAKLCDRRPFAGRRVSGTWANGPLALLGTDPDRHLQGARWPAERDAWLICGGEACLVACLSFPSSSAGMRAREQTPMGGDYSDPAKWRMENGSH